MTITRWECWLVETPTHSNLTTSYGPQENLQRRVVIRLTDSEGRVGLGESSPLSFFTGETAASVKLQLEQIFLPALIGRDPFEHDAIMAELDRLLPENRSAKSPVDMALYDLRGQILGRPVYEQLGGLRAPAGITVTRPIGILSLSDTVREAEKWVEQGYRTLKMKIGLDPLGDIGRVLAVRKAFPAEVRIRVDANQGYDLASATRVLRALEGAVEYCEQPLPARSLQALRTLRAQSGIPITLDESVHTMPDLVAAIQAEAVDCIVIKLIKCGGVRAAERLMGTAAAFGIAAVVVSTFETHVGASAGVHLAMSAPLAPYAHELSIFCVEPEGPHTRGSVPTAPGRLLPPRAPGLGAQFTPPDRKGVKPCP